MSRLDRLLKQGDKAAEHMTRQTERRLIRNYQDGLKEIRNKLSKRAEQGVLTQAQMAKYGRLERMEKEIGKEISKLTGKNASNLRKGIGAVYEDQYYRTGFAVEREAQAKLGFGKLDRDTIEAAIDSPVDRVGFLRRNRENSQRLTRQMQEQLTQGLTQGEGYEKIARRLKERMDIGATDATRIARTECHRAQSQGRLKGFDRAEKAGVQAKRVWDSALDDRTRETHQDMDGAVADEEGYFYVDGIQAEGPGLTGEPAEDINCRCAVRMEIVGYEPKLRRARGEGTIPYTNYNDWKKNRIDK